MNDKTLLAIWTATLVTALGVVNTAAHGPDGAIILALAVLVAGIGGFVAGRALPP